MDGASQFSGYKPTSGDLSGWRPASVRVADPDEGARELLETPCVDYFARLNAMTAQLEPAAEIHWS